MLTTKTLDGLIIKDPNLRGGRPILAGTGVTVRTIAGYYKLGLTPEETANETGLDLALVYAALAYYHLNQDEIEADIRANVEEPSSPVLTEAVAHRRRVHKVLGAAGLSLPAPTVPPMTRPFSTERREELARLFSTPSGRPVSELILEEREGR